MQYKYTFCYLLMVPFFLQTGRSVGEFPPLHPQLPAPSAHLPQTGRQKGSSQLLFPAELRFFS